MRSVDFSRVAAQFAHHLWRHAIVAAILILMVFAALNHKDPGGSLRVGYNDFPPYVFADEHGAPAGMAVEVVQSAAALKHIRLEWVPVEDAEKALRSGQIDLFPLLTVTSPRKAAWYSSMPWWEASLSLVSLREHPLKDASGTVGRRIAIRDTALRVSLPAGILPGARLFPTRGARRMIGAMCAGDFDGVLLDARLIYDALLAPPTACTGQKLLLVPMPQTSSRLATFARGAARSTAGRLYAGVEQLALDGTMTAIANRWFALPQQRYVREQLARRQEVRLGLLFAAGIFLLAGFTFWHWRRTLGIRRIARQAWTRAVEAEHRFETFMAHTPAISYMKEPSGRIVYVNDAFVRFHGVSSQGAIGKLDKDLFGENTGTIRDRDHEVLHSGKPLQYVLPQRGRDGEVYYWLVLKFLVTGEACEPRIGVVAVDITEQQRTAELVASSEERYRMLFEEAPVSIHEIDREGLVTRINRAGRMLCGYDAEEIIGRPAWEFVAPQLREESRAAIRAKIDGTRKLAPFERHYQRKDGQMLRVEVHETAILGADGTIQGLRSCLVNLTELYKARERLDAYALQLQQNNAALALALKSANEATRLKGQFLANMSHEIRTPMNGVLGMAELLMQSGLTEAQHSLARSVSQSGEHLLAIINDILDFSKVESGKLVLETVAFDLTATVEAAIELMAPAAQTKGLELTYWIAAELRTIVMGDGSRLRQALLNLVGNALKFTASGEVSVQITTAAGCDRVHVAVTDTGIGIPEAAKAHLFAPFTQADSSTTRRFGGTGLGLAITKSIVELMSGEIGFESREGGGSTFWFTALLPAAPDQPAFESRRLPDARLLILEKPRSGQSVLQRHLRAWGLSPRTVMNVPETLAALRAEHFDAALIDMQIPGVDAGGLLREIAADSSLNSTPILRLTSIGGSPQGNAAMNIHKPVKPAILFDALRRILQPSLYLQVAPAVAVSPRVSARRGRILIAEDNLVNQRVARLQVGHCGFEADVVGSGEEALAALAQMSYALVLMDCQMPGMDGYTATRELRRLENGASHVPVIALTANAFAADRDACLEAGMDDHLSKPVSLRDLAAVLDRWSAIVREA